MEFIHQLFPPVLFLLWQIRIVFHEKAYGNMNVSRYDFKWNQRRHLLSSACWLIRVSENCTVALIFLHKPNSPYLALNASLAAAAVAGVAVQAAVASTFLPREADGSEFSFLSRIYTSNARGSQQGSAPLGGQRLQEKTVVHLHPIHIKVLIWYVIQSQQVGLSALHCAVPRQLWKTVSVELGSVDNK